MWSQAGKDLIYKYINTNVSYKATKNYIGDFKCIWQSCNSKTIWSGFSSFKLKITNLLVFNVGWCSACGHYGK